MEAEDRTWQPAAGTTLRGSSTGAGPLVVFLHAGGERRQVWTPVIEHVLAAHHFRCVALDQRGHGESGGVGTNVSTFGSDLAHVLSVEDEPCVLVGCSLGGMAAIASVAEPQVQSLVRGIVLVDVVPHPDPVRARCYLEGQKMLRKNDVLVEDILANGARLSRLLGARALPVMLVRGGQSPICDDEAVARLHELVSALKVTSVANAGHLVARDSPVALADIVGPTAAMWHLGGVSSAE